MPALSVNMAEKRSRNDVTGVRMLPEYRVNTDKMGSDRRT